jgi:hypothetical protein
MMSEFKTVSTKKYTRFGKVYPATPTEFDVRIIPQQEITIRLNSTGREAGRHTRFSGERIFQVGEWAEYDSWNLNYLGKIVAITNKTVTIVDYPNSHNPCKKRLDIHTFCWRNFSKSIEEKRADNADTRMYI